jgi:hypothetical protein
LFARNLEGEVFHRKRLNVVDLIRIDEFEAQIFGGSEKPKRYLCG